MDTGPLRIARDIKPFTLVVGRLAYGGKRGSELACRFERSGNTDTQIPRQMRRAVNRCQRIT